MSSRPSMDGYRKALESSIGEFRESLAASARSLSECVKRLRRGGSLTVVSHQLSHAATILSSVTKLNEEAQQLARQCAEVSERSYLEAESHLREVCSKRGWRMDGQWPDFIVDYGVSVHIDESKHVLTIESAVATLDDLEMKLVEHTTGLVPKTFSADQFMKKLADAYDRVAGSKGVNVPILELYRELVIMLQSPRFWRNASAVSFSPLTIAQFRAQFSRMLEAGMCAAPDGRELRLLPPLDPKDAIFMYQPAERRFGFVGRIELSRI